MFKNILRRTSKKEFSKVQFELMESHCNMLEAENKMLKDTNRKVVELTTKYNNVIRDSIAVSIFSNIFDKVPDSVQATKDAYMIADIFLRVREGNDPANNVLNEKEKTI